MSVYGGPEVVDSGLVLSLDAGNTRSYPGSGTTWTDLSGNGNTATLVNSPNFNFLNNGSFSFNGSNTYCTIPSASNLLTFGTTDFSISFWIYLNSTAVNHTILTNYNEYNSGFNSYLIVGFWSSSGQINMLHAAGNYTAGATVTANTWSHICFTKTGTTFNVYLNGSLANTTTSASNDYSGTGRTILIGGGLADFGYLNGNLAGLHINRGTALTAAQVAQNYSATVGRYSNLPFSPSNISGLQLWLDASEAKSLFSDTAGTTLATTDGTSIALWKDKSGNSRNASQSTSSYRPLLKTGTQNSLTTMRFDGSDDFFALPSGNYGDSLTCFIVYKWTMASVSGNAGYLYAFAGGTSPKQKLNAMYMNGAQPVYYFGERTNTAYIANTTKDVFILNVTTFTPTYGAANLATYNNGSSISISSLNSIGSGGALNDNTIGADKNTSAIQQFTGDMAEIIVYNSVLSSTQRQQVESYLNTKWKVY